MQFNDCVGVVRSVDTGSVAVSINSDSALPSLKVGGFCALSDEQSDSWLIATIESISRPASNNVAQPETPATAVMTLLGQVRSRDGGFRFLRSVESFPRLGSRCFVMSESELGTVLDLTASSFDTEELVEVGSYSLSSGTRARISGNRFFQRHSAIVGSTGSGKSWAVASLLERASQLPGSNIVLFDLHGEYQTLSESEVGFASRLRIAGPGDLQNPGKDVLFLPHWLLSRDEMLSIVADIRQESAYIHAARFVRHVFDLKSEWRNRHQQEDNLKTFTLDSPIPYSLDELISRLEFDNNEMVEGNRAGSEKQGPYFGKLTRLLDRFRDRVADPRNGFLFRAPEESESPEWLGQLAVRLLAADQEHRGIKIIDFSEVPADLISVVASTLARLLYTVQFWLAPSDRTPLCIVCDEAHLYLPRSENADAGQLNSLESFERIAKEGRKYGVSLLVVSQRPSDLNSTILSQCSNFLALRLSSERDKTAVRALLPDSMKGVSDLLPILDTGETLVIGDAVLFPTRIKFDAPEIRPRSSSMEFWNEWRKTCVESRGISAAVDNLRRQGRGSGD
ncbi:MAG: ATP-binding protein [Planctomyces sp.]